MKITTYFKNNDGLTLVELLASTVILVIILVGVFNVFSNSIIISQKTEEKLTAINVAEKVLRKVSNESPDTSYTEYPFERPIVNGKIYYPVVTMFTQTNEETKLDLKRFRVQIYLNEENLEGTAETELYGYIEMGGQS